MSFLTIEITPSLREGGAQLRATLSVSPWSCMAKPSGARDGTPGLPYAPYAGGLCSTTGTVFLADY